MVLALQFLLSLSILILFHEMGHFIPAKLFKTKVEKFYLFFDPWFSLFKKKVGETEYGIGWLPLGGYVKISGMVDESMDKEQLAQPPQPWEFRSKPAWQRLIIMVGGVTVNILLAVFIYAMVMWTYGKETIRTANVTYGVHCDSLMYQYGFRDGDKILALNGVDQLDFDEINKDLILDDIKTVTVERFGERRELQLPNDFGQMVVDSNVRLAFAIRFPCVVDSVLENTAAKVAGLAKGDSLVGVNSFYSPFFQDIQRQIIKHKGKTIMLHLVRDGRQLQLPVAVSNEGTIGFAPKDVGSYFEKTKREYTLAQAFPAGLHEAWNKITDYTSQLRFVFSKSGAKQVGGFVTFAKLFPSTWNWPAFWLLTAWISVVLAFMNILPIPALDGGHVMFLLWEMITGKAVSQKVLERAQMVGLVLLLSLMVYANGMDIFRIFSK